MTRQTKTLTHQQTPTTSPLSSGILQRKCDACGQHTIAGGECEECQKKRSVLQLCSTNQATFPEVPPIVHEVLRSPSQPLEPGTRTFMESCFGHNFSQVRVHADTQASESARSIDALAYTVGRDIVFASGHYSPDTPSGQYLLAHELAHVMQQGNVLAPKSLSIGQPDSTYEQDADRAAKTVVNLRGTPTDLDLPQKLVRTPTIQRLCPGQPQQKTGNAIVSGNRMDYEKAVVAGTYCRDIGITGFFHGKETCYREVPPRKSYGNFLPGDQVCFDNKTNRCTPSYDAVSPVESRNPDGSCNLHFFGSIGHAFADVIPWLLENTPIISPFVKWLRS